MSFVHIEKPAAGPDSPRMDAEWLDAHWMPYTGNRQFKANPRMIVEGSGAYYTDSEGRKIFDGLSGLWCAGLGHGRREIAEAIGKQAMKLDYAPAFQFGHPASFALANKIKELTPAGLDHVFFTGSGSEAADTALKMAIAYHRARGEGQRTRLITAGLMRLVEQRTHLRVLAQQNTVEMLGQRLAAGLQQGNRGLDQIAMFNRQHGSTPRA